MAGLKMSEFLEAVRDDGATTREALLARGWPSKVIYAKAEKAARKGYTEYGVVAEGPWLTEKGVDYLENAIPVTRP